MKLLNYRIYVLCTFTLTISLTFKPNKTDLLCAEFIDIEKINKITSFAT